jgi:hypothetical protein
MATRRPLDAYHTAPWQVDALVDRLPEITGSIWCLCVGDGSSLQRLRERRPDLGPFVTNDLTRACPADFHLDATHPATWSAMVAACGHPDWVIDNFPSRPRSTSSNTPSRAARRGVVAMARVSFVEGTKSDRHQGGRARRAARATHPRIKQIALERYSYTGNGKSDQTTTEWLVWANCRSPTRRPHGLRYKDGSPQERRRAEAAAIVRPSWIDDIWRHRDGRLVERFGRIFGVRA